MKKIFATELSEAVMRARPSCFPGPAGTKPEGAIVMDADYRALGIVRSLGRRGIPVCVIRHKGRVLASASRYCRRRAIWPSDDDARQLEFLIDLAERSGLHGWMLFPTDDYMVAFIARHERELAEHFHISIPPERTLGWTRNKRLMHELAHELGISQPRTFCVQSSSEVDTVNVSFPVILKPAVRESVNPLASDKAWVATDRKNLKTLFGEALKHLAPNDILIQEIVPGLGEAQYSFAALFYEGEPIVSVTARRTRQLPMDFGQFSTFVETIDEPELTPPAVRFMKAIGYTGMAELEFKKDAVDGQFKLLDINPRVWGWHTIDARAEGDFPYLLWRLARGESVPAGRAPAGLQWVRITADVVVAVSEMLKGRLKLSSYLGELHRPTEFAVFAYDDLVPGLIELPELVLSFIGSSRATRSTLRFRPSTPHVEETGTDPQDVQVIAKEALRFK